MRRGMIVPLLAAAFAGETAASACVSVREETRIADADAVIDGVAVCFLARGRCRLRATEIVKDDARRRMPSETYIIRFEPGAIQRWRSAIEAGHGFNICFVPWEPESTRLQGRFYLDRVQGGYHPRPGSVRRAEDSQVGPEEGAE